MSKRPIPYGYELIQDAPKYLVGEDIIEQKMAEISIKEKIKMGALKANLYSTSKKDSDKPPFLKLAKDFILSDDFDSSFLSSAGWTLWNTLKKNQEANFRDVTENDGLEKPNVSLFDEGKILPKTYERIYGLVIIERELLDKFQRTSTGGNREILNELGVEIPNTGAPGRPSSWHLIEPYFEKRLTNRECENMISKEAIHLSEWKNKTYPNHPPIRNKSLENKIREKYNKYKNKMIAEKKWPI